MKAINLFCLLFVILLFPVQKANAQRYKTERVRAYLVSLPLEPLADDINTYNSRIKHGEIDFRYIEKNPPLVNINSATKNNFSSPEKCEEEYLTLRGYERSSENPDITFTVDFKAIDIKSKELKDRVGTFIENKQKVSRKMYLYQVSYSYGATFRVHDRHDSLIYEERFYDPEETLSVVVGDPIDGIGHNAFSITALNEMMESDFIGKFQQEITKKCLEKAETKIKSTWAYALYYYDFPLATDHSTRKVNYDDLNLALKLTSEAIEMSNTEEGKPAEELYQDKAAIEGYTKKLYEAIVIWQKALEEADYDDRRARIHRNLAPMLHCNIATAAILARNWELAKSSLEEAQKHQESAQTASWLDYHMKNLKKRYEIHGLD